MKAIVVADQAAGPAGMQLVERHTDWCRAIFTEAGIYW
jgi:hypothetical protein